MCKLSYQQLIILLFAMKNVRYLPLLSKGINMCIYFLYLFTTHYMTIDISQSSCKLLFQSDFLLYTVVIPPKQKGTKNQINKHALML